MSERTRFIGINKRVPIDLIDKYIHAYIRAGSINRDAIKADIASVYHGKNRADKCAIYIWRILTNDEALMSFIKMSIGSTRYAKLKHTDRMALILALVASAFPIFADILSILAKVYRVAGTQSTVAMWHRRSVISMAAI